MKKENQLRNKRVIKSRKKQTKKIVKFLVQNGLDILENISATGDRVPTHRYPIHQNKTGDDLMLI